MKKGHIFWAFAAALALAACNTTMEMDDAPESLGGIKVLSVKATPAEATKTAYADDKTFSWSVGDEVSIRCNDGIAEAWTTFTASDAAATSTLTATVSGGMEPGSLGGRKAALYPASADHGYLSDGSILFHLPAERDFRAAQGGHDEAAVPMFAWGDDNDTYAFANLTGAVKFSFSGISAGITEVQFTFTSAGEKMNGTFMLTGLDAGDAASVTWAAATAADEAEKTLTFYADVQSGSAHFYVPYPAGTLSAGSRICLQDANGGAVLYENDALKAITVAKNKVVVLPPLLMGPSSLTLTESDEDIINPERGFYAPVEYDISFDGTPTLTKAPAGTLLQENSLVHIMFYLWDFLWEEHINEAALNSIRTVLDGIRTDGKKAIIRFAYTRSTTAVRKNPIPANVLNHIGDVAPIFSEYEDIIYLVQAGFLGTWGGWWPGHTTDYPNFEFGTDPNQPEKPDNTNLVLSVGGRDKVLEALLAAVPASRQVALRTPYYKRYLVYGKRSGDDTHKLSPATTLKEWDRTDAVGRVSFHNEGFRSKFKHKTEDPVTMTVKSEDEGTFNEQSDREMWRDQSPYLAVGGSVASFEGRADNFERLFHYEWNGKTYSYASAKNTWEALYIQHISYLNGDAGPFLDRWAASTDGYTLTDIRKALGYRLWLSRAVINFSGTTTGSTAQVKLTLHNSGAVSVINKRPMKLVLIQGNGSVTELADLGDVREVTSKSNKAYTLNFTLPENLLGGAKLALWLPDNAPSLQDKAAYAIRLANNETTFEGAQGFNVFYTF